MRLKKKRIPIQILIMKRRRVIIIKNKILTKRRIKKKRIPIQILIMKNKNNFNNKNKRNLIKIEMINNNLIRKIIIKLKNGYVKTVINQILMIIMNV